MNVMNDLAYVNQIVDLNDGDKSSH